MSQPAHHDPPFVPAEDATRERRNGADRSPDKLTLSVDEAARLLGISSGLAYELVRKGELAAVRLGRRILVPRHVVEALVGPFDGVS